MTGPSGDASTVQVLPNAGGTGVTRLLLDRPPANAFDLNGYRRLLEALTELAAAPPLVLQVGSNVDRFFSGGRDLNEPAPVGADAVAERGRIVTALYETLLHFPCPTIAVIDGYALGAGCVIASICDLRVATERAVFGLPEVKVGSVGGARHLARLLPHGVVRQMALTAEPIDARQAERYGMVDLVGQGEDPWTEANRLASIIEAFDPQGVARVKRALDAAAQLPLAEGLALELASRDEV